MLTLALSAQQPIETKFIKKTSLQTESLVSIDNFKTFYFLNASVLEKKDPDKTITYSNVQLGDITSANTYNPLKINIFYRDFNTVVILDNRLAEIFKIDFNNLTPYKSISHVSTGHDNTLWVFNQDTQQLELYDYKANTTRTKTLPIASTVMDLKSNYNYCWLLTNTHLYIYNYFGSLIRKIENNGFTSMVETNGNLVLKKDNVLYFLKKNTEAFHPIATPNLLIKQFFVTNETLYIYNDKTLSEYQILIN
ncbi:hypothetical protein GCM10022395_36360 [Snuella lapsa]|uniref:Uncharacterized protein n=2 Tax=Snuella lapsa TaxID=870481 RepID=A0ABP6YMC3_9FLAO